jgi:AcrR family transcriptional regulator
MSTQEQVAERPPGSSARERILAAAVNRIAREGIEDVRIARIAMDAGVSTALVHYHFDTRDALLAEALEYSFEHAGDARVGPHGELTGSHAERLAQMVDQCLPLNESLELDWVLWVEMWLRVVRHPEFRPIAEELYWRMQRWFARAIREGVEAGEFNPCDVDQVADRAVALIDGFGVRTLIGESNMPLERARHAIGAALARDLGVGEQLPFS